MKKLLILFVTTVVTFSIFSQTPQRMSYQCVVRGPGGALVTNQTVGIRISILQGSPVHTEIFRETYDPNPTTNANGLLTLEVGSGTAETGHFSAIDWASGPYFLKSEIDPAGGTNYTIAGQSQILSVPFALYAKDVENKDDADADPLNEIQVLGISGSNLSLNRGGGSVVIPGDDWGTQHVSTDATLTGNGLASSPLKIAQQSATNGKVLKWNGSSWAPADDATGTPFTLPYSGSIAHNDYAFKVTNSLGSGIRVVASATEGITRAVYGEIKSGDASSYGVYGVSTSSTGNGHGVVGLSYSPDGFGVTGIASALTGYTRGTSGFANSSQGTGIYGYAPSETGATFGVHGASNSVNGAAVYGTAYASSGVNYGVRASVVSSEGFSGYFSGGRFYVGGNLGIGTTTPSAKLEVAGQVKITGGTPGAGQVLTSDAAGLASWEPIPEPAVNHIYFEVKRDTSYNWPLIASVQKVDFSTNSSVWENKGGAFNQSTSTFTAPEDGIYSFQGAIYFTNITSGYLIYAYLSAGGRFYNGNRKLSGGTSEMVDVSMTLFMSKGEMAQLWGYVNDPTPPAEVYGNTANYTYTYFSGAKVR